MLGGEVANGQRVDIGFYENFINEILRTNLKNYLERRATCAGEIQEYVLLQRTIENLTNFDCDPLKTKVDLGCGFFVQAEVPDVSKITVAIGHGLFLELTQAEALDFIKKKVLMMSERLALLEEESSKLNADIKIMLENLGLLQQV
uniref:EOG090X0MWD n=1 Tax=Evadne anonyx TaxID=141404 RepID=A0A9N6WQT9_9CRUS|nr:EOG090X0MWD [Evadne anonyx]